MGGRHATWVEPAIAHWSGRSGRETSGDISGKSKSRFKRRGRQLTRTGQRSTEAGIRYHRGGALSQSGADNPVSRQQLNVAIQLAGETDI